MILAGAAAQAGAVTADVLLACIEMALLAAFYLAAALMRFDVLGRTGETI